MILYPSIAAARAKTIATTAPVCWSPLGGGFRVGLGLGCIVVAEGVGVCVIGSGYGRQVSLPPQRVAAGSANESCVRGGV